MYLGKGKAHQTNTIDDVDAVARAIQGGRSKFQPKKKKTMLPKPSGQQNAGVSKQEKSPATASTRPRFYQKDGLRVPLFEKCGKRKTSTRLSQSLRNKSTDYLLRIVEEYAGEARRKAFKDAHFAKVEIADWIEKAERRALPAHPRSKLPKHLVTDEEFLVNTHDPAWAEELVIEDAKGKAAVQDKCVSGKHEGNVIKQAIDTIAAKRKRDIACEPAQAEQQTPKKLKLHHTDEQKAGQSNACHKHRNGQAKAKPRKVHVEEEEPTAHVSEEMKPEEIFVNSTIHDDDSQKQARKAEDLRVFMEDKHTKMHPGNPDRSSLVVYLEEEGEDRILTASILKTGETIMHNTSIPHNYGTAHFFLGKPTRPEAPFLKKGKHGRHGDFVNDPDRRAGRGHQITPGDCLGLEDYISYRGQVLKAYSRYPRIGEDQDISPKVERDWKDNKNWYRKFVGKYPGNTVSHLWPCGCEKVGVESEGEESEEE